MTRQEYHFVIGYLVVFTEILVCWLSPNVCRSELRQTMHSEIVKQNGREYPVNTLKLGIHLGNEFACFELKIMLVA